MNTNFDETELMKHLPCRDGLEYARSLKFDFHEIYEKCERSDWLIWLLRESQNITEEQSVEIAIACAEYTIGKFESKYPEDKRPRLAIEAAKKWLANPSDAYAYAAYAAYAVGSDAAYAAANAAANAAYAGGSDAYATTATSDATSELKGQADTIRKIVTNPFKKRMTK